MKQLQQKDQIFIANPISKLSFINLDQTILKTGKENVAEHFSLVSKKFANARLLRGVPDTR